MKTRLQTGLLSDEEIQRIRAEAVYSGYEVIEDPEGGWMEVRSIKDQIVHKPKRRFFE